MLTILTSPPGWKACLKKRRIGGHFAVTRSLLDGLDRIGTPYRYNPKLAWFCTKKVLVLAGVDTLKRAIRLKESGRITFLATGPNISVLPSWDDNVLADPSVDLCIVPCQWVQDTYEEDSPQLRGRIRIWWAGIDERIWRPDPKISKGNEAPCLVYAKSADAPTNEVMALLQALGIPFKVIKYGEYTPKEYKNLLSACSCVIALSRSESQGIFLAEAWAMGVPTFSWNPPICIYKGKIFKGASSAPYVSPLTGAIWTELEELAALLQSFIARKVEYNPREWVLKNMTDPLVAKKMLKILAN